MSVDESNPLYDACVGFMVSEKSEADSWEKIARFVATKVANGEGEEEKLRAEFVVVEQQIKHDFKVTTLPVAWRTAKSSALSAARAGVELLSGSSVKPKSALELEVKAKLETVKGVRSLGATVSRHLENARIELAGSKLEGADEGMVMTALGALYEQITISRGA